MNSEKLHCWYCRMISRNDKIITGLQNESNNSNNGRFGSVLLIKILFLGGIYLLTILTIETKFDKSLK